MKVSVNISFDFNDRCKNLIKTLYEKNSLVYETFILETKSDSFDGNFDDLVRLKIFGMIDSSEEYETPEIMISKFWLTTVGKVFYKELFEHEH